MMDSSTRAGSDRHFTSRRLASGLHISGAQSVTRWGRVLDAGAGAGRVSLHLQSKGHDVLAIDNSPGAIEVCRRRGVRDACVLAFDAVDQSYGKFDTIVLLGNNFGLFGTPAKAQRLLRRLHRLTTDRARIIVESRDVEQRADLDAHRRYHQRNLARGRLPGQIRIRVRFRDIVGPLDELPDGYA